MQSTTLTRKELYELIWSKPMTTVAKDFGVSDVWISKICKEDDTNTRPKLTKADIFLGCMHVCMVEMPQ
jgi:hypothetical protein